MTTVGDGLFEYGGKPAGGVPGMGVPGNTYWLHPSAALASDGNAGTSPERPLKTLSRAHTLMTANQNDVVYMLGNSSASAANVISETAGVTLSKNLCHYIGTAYNRVSHRVSVRNDGNGIANLITVSADGCTFANFHVMDDNATAEDTITWTETGQRNAHYNLHIAGMGSSTALGPFTRAGSVTIQLSGDGERFFKDCVFGVDTVTRSAANTTMKLVSSAVRDWIEDCFFPMHTDDAAAVFLEVPDSGLDRWIYFKRCMFLNAINSASTALTKAFTVGAVSGGTIILNQCEQHGCGGQWDDAAGSDIITNGAYGAATGGIMLPVTA